ncbi:MAG TPA: helix-turn-helix domain-containing protein [Ilumatobacter sp.]|nr:helix-turn-helix domain-containing protein [Ilumatobacter sp.]
MITPLSFEERAARHAALGDPVRLAVVDGLTNTDRSPQELQRLAGIPSNLLAHHLDVLESVGLIVRGRSSGDGRRRYVHLLTDALDELGLRLPVEPQPALFVCTANSARSQLAAAMWTDVFGEPALSAGTHPAPAVHPGAKAAAKRAGLDLSGAEPRRLDDVTDRPALVVTVCDRAYEELDPGGEWLHWSIPDPVPDGSRDAFDRTVDELRTRIRSLHAA